MNDDSGGCLGLIVTVLVVWLAWPIGLWFFIAVVCAAIVHSFTLTDGSSKPSSDAGFWHAALPALRDAAWCITIGLGIVSLGQIVLSTTKNFSPATVKRWEEAVTQLQRQFSAVMGTPDLLWILAFLVLLSLLLNKRLIARFVKLRRWARNALLVLTTVASFTYFSSLAVSNNQPRWVAQRRMEAKEAVDTIENNRRELVSLVWIEQSLTKLPNPMKRELRAFFKTTAPMPDGPDIVVPRAAEILAISAESIQEEGQPRTTDSLQRVSEWIESTGSAPALDDVATVVRTARQNDKALTDARVAAEEALKAVLGSVVSKEAHPLIQPFIKALSSALVKSSLARLSTRELPDYTAAVTFVKTKLKWPWTFPPAVEAPDGESHLPDTPMMPARTVASPSFVPPTRTPGVPGYSGVPYFYQPFRQSFGGTTGFRGGLR